MMRAALLFAMALALPPACDKLMGKSTAPADTSDPTPPPLPVTSATTPPAWRPPEAPAVDAGPSDYARAKVYADQKNWKAVRAILERKVRAGGAPQDEAQLFLAACSAMKDKSCLTDMKKKYPSLEPP